MTNHNPFHSDELRQDLLELVRQGLGRSTAAKQLDASPAALHAWLRANPSFRADLEEAEDEAIEPVLSMLRARALNKGDVSAAREYLRHVAPPPRSTAQKIEHTLDSSAVDRIKALQAALAERALAAPVQEIIEAHATTKTKEKEKEKEQE